MTADRPTTEPRRPYEEVWRRAYWAHRDVPGRHGGECCQDECWPDIGHRVLDEIVPSLRTEVEAEAEAASPPPAARLCHDPRHDEIEAWYRQALALARGEYHAEAFGPSPDTRHLPAGEAVYLGSSVEDAFYEAQRRWRSRRDSDPKRLSVHDLVEQAFAAHGLRIEAEAASPAAPVCCTEPQDHARHVAEAQGGAPRAEELDVERLTRAIEIEDDRLPFLDAGIDSTATPRAVAEQVAERYARLSTKEGRE